jgi:hypothetical protein
VRAGARSAAALVAAVAALTLVVLGAASGVEWHLEERELWTLRPPEATEPPPTQPETFDDAPLRDMEPVDWTWLATVVWVVITVVLAIVAWWMVRWLRERLWLRRLPAPVEPGGEVIDDLEDPDLPTLRRGVEQAQRDLAASRGATDAVIAAWLALEDAAASSGVARQPAQTPTEFTVAVLDRTDADPAAVRELLALYHRARFSNEPVVTADVDAASTCLGRLAASWDALRTDPPVRR